MQRIAKYAPVVEELFTHGNSKLFVYVNYQINVSFAIQVLPAGDERFCTVLMDDGYCATYYTALEFQKAHGISALCMLLAAVDKIDSVDTVGSDVNIYQPMMKR